MKKILLPLLFLPASLAAQQLQLGAGLSTNTFPSNTGLPSGDRFYSASPAVSLRFVQPVLRHFEIGAELSATNWRNRIGLEVASPDAPLGRYTKVPVIMAQPVIGLGLQFNYHPHFGRHSLKVGVYAGGLFAVERAGTQEDVLREICYSGGAGFALGGQVGYEFAVTKRFSVGLDCMPRYAQASTSGIAGLSAGNDRKTYALWYFPAMLTAGVRL